MQHVDGPSSLEIEPRLWLNFLAESGHRCRYWGAFENHGELPTERTDTHRAFDLHPSDAMSSLTGRLVTEWSKDAINWAKKGPPAAAFPVLEALIPRKFPSRAMTTCSWTGRSSGACSRTPGTPHGAPPSAPCRATISSATRAPASTTSARPTVRSASSVGGWRTQVTVTAGTVPCASSRTSTSITRDTSSGASFGCSVPSTPMAEVDSAEAHYKRALLTRQFGMNRN
jgi:hypothetical protein